MLGKVLDKVLDRVLNMRIFYIYVSLRDSHKSYYLAVDKL